jgi:hypothetical protein
MRYAQYLDILYITLEFNMTRNIEHCTGHISIIFFISVHVLFLHRGMVGIKDQMNYFNYFFLALDIKRGHHIQRSRLSIHFFATPSSQSQSIGLNYSQEIMLRGQRVYLPPIFIYSWILLLLSQRNVLGCII